LVDPINLRSSVLLGSRYFFFTTTRFFCWPPPFDTWDEKKRNFNSKPHKARSGPSPSRVYSLSITEHFNRLAHTPQTLSVLSRVSSSRSFPNADPPRKKSDDGSKALSHACKGDQYIKSNLKHSSPMAPDGWW